MNVGIIGLPQTGKKTLFKLLVGPDALAGHADPREVVRGVAEIPDPRFDDLVAMYHPRKEARARLELVLLPAIEDETVAEGKIFRDMGEIEAFAHVVRVFEDESVYHAWGGPDPLREIEFMQSELVLHDHVFVEKRLERIEKHLAKAADERAKKERELLERFAHHLEQEKPLRLLEVSDPEAALIASYPLLTLRGLVVVLNVSDRQIGDTRLLEEVRERLSGRGIGVVQVAVEAEAEIASLEDAGERAEFMREMGIEDTALHALAATCIEALGLNSFFTVAPKEVHHWFVRRGATALRAAGTVHSDLERGFIRAEVMKCDDLLAAGSEEALKAEGKVYLKGKDYVVEDGDILYIRFNV